MNGVAIYHELEPLNRFPAQAEGTTSQLTSTLKKTWSHQCATKFPNDAEHKTLFALRREGPLMKVEMPVSHQELISVLQAGRLRVSSDIPIISGRGRRSRRHHFVLAAGSRGTLSFRQRRTAKCIFGLLDNEGDYLENCTLTQPFARCRGARQLSETTNFQRWLETTTDILALIRFCL